MSRQDELSSQNLVRTCIYTEVNDIALQGCKQLGKQLHVTIKQINAELSVITHCHGDVLQPQQSSMQTLSQKSSGRKWIYQKWVEGETFKEVSGLAVKLRTKV